MKNDRFRDRFGRMTEILKLVLRQRTIHPQVDDRSVIMLLSPHAIRTQIIREVVMATTGIVVCSPYGMACTECNDLLGVREQTRSPSHLVLRELRSTDRNGGQSSY